MNVWKWIRSLFRPLFRALRRSLRRYVRPADYRRLLKRVDALEWNAENALLSRYLELAPSDPREQLRSREFQVTSQNGEDGLLLYIFSLVGTTNRRSVEFVMGDGSECNSANLILNFGWGGLLMDCSARDIERARRLYHEEREIPKERLRIETELVTAENINELLEKHGMKGEIDLLSVDIDGNDYWLWKAIQVVEPRVVAIEYNASFGASEPLICVYRPDFDARSIHPSGWYHGAALAALTRLGQRLGYALVGCDSSGVNAFYVRRDVLDGRLSELDPDQAFYPHRRRLDKASELEQLELLRNLEFARDD